MAGKAACVATAAGACSSGGPGASPGKPPGSPGTPTGAMPSPTEQAERDRIAGALAAVQQLDGAGLLARYPSGAPLAAGAALSYDPTTAANLNLIQSSAVGLSASKGREPVSSSNATTASA